MVDYDVGAVDINEYSNIRDYDGTREEDEEEYRFAEISEYNHNGIDDDGDGQEDESDEDKNLRDIHESSQDFMLRTGYWIKDKHPSKVNDSGTTQNNYPLDMEIYVKPYDETNTSLQNARPLTSNDGDDMTKTSVTAGVGVALGPFSVGVSYSYPFITDDKEVIKDEYDRYGHEWTIDMESYWPESEENPDDDSDVDDLPTVEFEVAPDAEGDDVRWIKSYSVFNWKYMDIYGNWYYRDTGVVGSYQWYERVP